MRLKERLTRLLSRAVAHTTRAIRPAWKRQVALFEEVVEGRDCALGLGGCQRGLAPPLDFPPEGTIMRIPTRGFGRRVTTR